MWRWRKGSVKRIRIAANIAITPPSLLGIERRMVYAHRKYHSGLIWRGVERGLAGMKFSGSVKMYGVRRQITAKARSIMAKPNTSLDV